MFRRPGKNPLDEDNTPHYKDESLLSSPYKYGPKKTDPKDIPPRMYESPHKPHVQPMAQPHEERGLQEDSWHNDKMTPLPHHFQEIVRDEEPETTLGEGVTFRGELSFERFLRIDGTFEGELLSQGKVIVGPKGIVRANLNLREAVIEGEVEGNITVQEKLELRGDASIKGDITAKSLCVDEGVTIIGNLTIEPKKAGASSSS